MRKLHLAISLLALTLCACGSTPPPEPPEYEVQVGILLLDGVQASELAAAQAVFERTRQQCPPGMKVVTVGRSVEPVTSAEGLRLIPDYSLDDAPQLDVLVSPGTLHSKDQDLEDATLIRWLATRDQEVDVFLGLGRGSYLLAHAGILNGHSCTVPAVDYTTFRERYKGIDIRRRQVFVADGNRITSLGGASSYDAALWIIEATYGRGHAAAIAHSLTLPWDPARIPHTLIAR